MSKKTFHVSGDIKVHGIKLVTRHGNLKELHEMIRFAELAEAAGIARYIQQVFYDSGCCLATFTFHVEPSYGDPVCLEVERLATIAISQFELCGVVHHGGHYLAVSIAEDLLRTATSGSRDNHRQGR